MEEENQFHITLVTQRRISRREAEAQTETERDPNAPPSEPEHAAHHHAEHHHTEQHHAAHHRSEHCSGASRHGGDGGEHGRGRTYQDYGTLTLGCMERAADAPEAARAAEPSQGELQREFYDKYDAVLSRRYHTRNKGKVNRILIIVLLCGAALILSLFGIGKLAGQTAETLSKPPVETLPVQTLGLGNEG